MDFTHFPQLFRASSPYIREHRDKRFVLLLPPSCFADSRLNKLSRDLALLQVLDIRLTLVIELEGQQTDVIQEAEQKTKRLDELFARGIPRSRYRNQSIPILVKNVAQSEVRVDGEEPSHVWYPVATTTQPRPVSTHPDNPVVVIRSMCTKSNNETECVSAPQVALSIATHSKADKLIVFNDPAVFHTPESEISSDWSVDSFENLLSSIHLDDSTRERLNALVQACRGGVKRTHIVSAEEDGALLTELFTADGSGTQISSDEYLTIRKATELDTEIIQDLMREDLEEESIIPRSQDLLMDPSTLFLIASHDNTPVGCVALYGLSEGMQEIGTLIASSRHRDQNIGHRLLSQAEKEARRREARATYVFTTSATSWFQQHDYEIADLSALPKVCTDNFDQKRNPTLLIKNLA